MGHYNTVVWVTDLSTGALPVPDVEVKIGKNLLKELDPASASLAEGRTGPDGTAELPGTSSIDPALKMSESYKKDAPWYFVWCRKGDDLALAPLQSDFTP